MQNLAPTDDGAAKPRSAKLLQVQKTENKHRSFARAIAATLLLMPLAATARKITCDALPLDGINCEDIYTSVQPLISQEWFESRYPSAKFTLEYTAISAWKDTGSFTNQAGIYSYAVVVKLRPYRLDDSGPWMGLVVGQPRTIIGSKSGIPGKEKPATMRAATLQVTQDLLDSLQVATP